MAEGGSAHDQDALPYMTPQQRSGMGRPTIYKPEYCKKIIEFGRDGASRAQIAARLNVAKATINLWEKKHPDFMNALQLASAYSQEWWENEAQLNLKSVKFNTALWMQSVKSRFRDDYGDRTEQRVVGHDGGAVQIDVTDKRATMDLARFMALTLSQAAGPVEIEDATLIEAANDPAE